MGGFLEKLGNNLGFGPGDTADKGKAGDNAEAAAKVYDGITPPKLSPVTLEGTTYAGDVNPDHVSLTGADAAQQGQTALSNISTDPRLRQAQLAALASMQGVADSGGMTDTDTANLHRIQNQADTDDAARRNAILQGMQQRGMGGSGAELLAQLSSSQAATDRQAQGGLDVAGMAQQRALQAMQGAGQMGGALRAQDYGEQANAASAQDAINRFNTSNIQSMNQYNSQTLNSGQLANAQMDMGAQVQNQGARQGVNNYNSGVNNQQTMYNNGQLPQQNFANQMQYAGAKGNALNGLSGFYGGQQNINTQTQAAKQGAVINGAFQMGAAAVGAPSAKKATDGGEEGGGDWLGGRIPGMAKMPGNHPMNDTFQAPKLSPGEVVVPRTLAQSASPSTIGSFVKHAPPTTAPANQKEAMLSALANIRRKHGG